MRKKNSIVTGLETAIPDPSKAIPGVVVGHQERLASRGHNVPVRHETGSPDKG